MGDHMLNIEFVRKLVGLCIAPEIIVLFRYLIVFNRILSVSTVELPVCEH